MKFAHPMWLFGCGIAALVAVLLVLGGFGLVRAIARFGDPERVGPLVTFRSAKRRVAKGVLMSLGVLLAFVAMARPQYGRGTRLIPATNLDVVIVLDYSKSMYARDVTPSRIARAKAEVARLVKELAGARFGAVAFAGEPIGFPLTSDGSAIAQFFRQLEPNDMPIGGTAIGRALERARELLNSDPKSQDHKRVIVLITDGEDLEGDPVAVAQSIAQGGTTIDVVQIGGRTPERVPEIDTAGKVAGYRTGEDGKPLVTQLTSDGEAQLVALAKAASGQIVRAEKGSTGIDVITNDLARMMHSELAERVETVYADVYYYPLGLALVVLVVETFISAAKRRGLRAPDRGGELIAGRAKHKLRVDPRKERARALSTTALMIVVMCCGFAGIIACNPARPFERNAPEVENAIRALDAGDASAASQLLETYLQTGSCGEGKIDTPDRVRDRPNGTFDLGLALFRIGESYGQRFGQQEQVPEAGPSPEQQTAAQLRSDQVDCALKVVQAIAGLPSTPLELAARAHYLAGNLEFLRHAYRQSIEHYDQALRLVPGLSDDAGDVIGRDVAWNRAVALRRIEDDDKKDAAPDSPPDSPPPDQNNPETGQDSGDSGGKDSGQPESGNGQDSGGGGDDAGKDSGGDEQSNPQSPEGGSGQDSAPPPDRNPNQDNRMLDMLEQAPILQLQEAKNRGARRKVRGMADK